MAKRKTPEGYVLDSVIQYLAIKEIFYVRMNAGFISLDREGKKRGIRLHEPGTADVMAIKQEECAPHPHSVIWIECKAPNGRQSDLQKQFQERVEAEGHRYILAFSVDDLIAAGL